LQKSWPALQAKSVSLIGVDVFEQASSAHGFLQKYGVTYTNVQDSLDGATSISYGVTGNPETYFIDKNGVVVARWIGALNERGLESALAKMQVN
jgi:cytochrome c biogenesis protein CcmG/thiol:disulfide interchange protein DsbE